MVSAVSATKLSMAEDWLLCDAGEYSAERLRELKANTAQLPASKVDQAAVKAASDSVFKLSGSFKKPGAPQDDRFEPLIQPVSALRSFHALYLLLSKVTLAVRTG